MNKLTLSIEAPVVQQAKQIAEANQTSVSAMFSQFVESMAAQCTRPAKIGPLTRKLTGLIKLRPGKEYKDLITDALMEKYKIAK
ncbi:MAG: DUF6364 family protein [Thermoguttaceae bacterium]|jgi:hypothetical protein